MSRICKDLLLKFKLRPAIAYLNSLPLLELGTNLPRPSPGEVLSCFGVLQVNYSDSDSAMCRFLQ